MFVFVRYPPKVTCGKSLLSKTTHKRSTYDVCLRIYVMLQELRDLLGDTKKPEKIVEHPPSEPEDEDESVYGSRCTPKLPGLSEVCYNATPSTLCTLPRRHAIVPFIADGVLVIIVRILNGSKNSK